MTADRSIQDAVLLCTRGWPASNLAAGRMMDGLVWSDSTRHSVILCSLLPSTKYCTAACSSSLSLILDTPPDELTCCNPSSQCEHISAASALWQGTRSVRVAQQKEMPVAASSRHTPVQSPAPVPAHNTRHVCVTAFDT